MDRPDLFDFCLNISLRMQSDIPYLRAASRVIGLQSIESVSLLFLFFCLKTDWALGLDPISAFRTLFPLRFNIRTPSL
jgi:hypothetical protein